MFNFEQKKQLQISYSYKIFSRVSELPEQWNFLAKQNILFSLSYLKTFEESSPKNVTCFYIGLYQDQILSGIAIAQLINLNLLESFGERDQCVKSFFRNLIFRNFCSNVLLVGNNFFTGQNAFIVLEQANKSELISTLKLAADALKIQINNSGQAVHITSIKDFSNHELIYFKKDVFNKFTMFSVQPNMVFPINKNWKNEQDYVADLSKKYRDQYKRAHKKAETISKRKLGLNEIKNYQSQIYKLYFYVAKNAPFNTFFLAENHFENLKKNLHENFLFYGYFINEQMVGFNTLIKNGLQMETYFLGYDEVVQREKMLYLNMLYDMIGYSIKKEFNEIIFARTALEIKSSIGAKPVQMTAFMKHENRFINNFMKFFINYFEPKIEWNERNPFK